MGDTNNFPTISGDQRLAELKEIGKFKDKKDYHSLTAPEIYEIDAAYDQYQIHKAENPQLYTRPGVPKAPDPSEGPGGENVYEAEAKAAAGGVKGPMAEGKPRVDEDEALLDDSALEEEDL